MAKVYGYSGHRMMARCPRGTITYETFVGDIFDKIEEAASFQRSAPTILRWYVNNHGTVHHNRVKDEDIMQIRYVLSVRIDLSGGPTVTLTSCAHNDGFQSVLYTVLSNNSSYSFRGLESAITKVNQLCGGDWWMMVVA